MSHITHSVLVPYSPRKMYQLVNDVVSYPVFLPGCTGSRIIASSINQMIASVDISKAGIKKTLTTCNTLDEAKSIRIQLVDGPFQKLTGGWKFFQVCNHTCQVEFNLEFEFTNIFIEMTFGVVFRELANGLVSAFTNRAKDIYND